MPRLVLYLRLVFFNDPALTAIYTLSLHDALPISTGVHAHRVEVLDGADDHDVVVLVAHQLQLVLLPPQDRLLQEHLGGDRKSTRLNSSHLGISYAVFCLKKKKKAVPSASECIAPI